MELCAYVGIPQAILESSKRADPECGRPQTMADIPFAVVDGFLRAKIANKDPKKSTNIAQDQLEYLENNYKSHSFKKNLPFVGPDFH